MPLASGDGAESHESFGIGLSGTAQPQEYPRKPSIRRGLVLVGMDVVLELLVVTRGQT
jgi:hypothetical protein